MARPLNQKKKADPCHCFWPLASSSFISFITFVQLQFSDLVGTNYCISLFPLTVEDFFQRNQHPWEGFIFQIFNRKVYLQRKVSMFKLFYIKL